MGCWISLLIVYDLFRPFFVVTTAFPSVPVSDFYFFFFVSHIKVAMPLSVLANHELVLVLLVIWLSIALCLVVSELPAAYFRSRKRKLPRVSTSLVDDLLNVFLDDQFLSYLGTSRTCFHMLCNRLEPHLRTQRKRMPLEKRVMVLLYHMRHRDTNEQISGLFDMAKGCVAENIALVMRAVRLEFQNEVKFPITPDELRVQRDGFRNMYGVPCVGIIDGLHIRVQCSRTDWLNYKSFKSVLSLLVCNYDGTFSYLTSGYPGSFNDAGAVQNSWFWDDGWRYLARAGDFLLGDSIFPLRSYLISLYDWNSMGGASHNQRVFQGRMSRTRSLIERTFARLYKRFPILYNCIRATTVEACVARIETAVILHNVFSRWNDPWGVVGAPAPLALDADDVAAIRRIHYRGSVAEGARRREEILHTVLGLLPAVELD